MRSFSVLLLLALLLSPEPTQAREYDLATILKLASQRNKEIKLAEAELQLASARKLEALSSALPKINLSLNYNRNLLENFFYVSMTDSLGRRTTTKFQVSFKNEYQLNAVLNQTIFGFGKIGNAIKAASYYRNLSQYLFDRRRQEVIIRVKKAFYQALLLQKVWEVALQSQTSAQENYENTKAKYESGLVSEFALLQAEVRWQNAIPEAMKAKQNYRLALNNLKILVDLPIEEELRLSGDLESYPPLPDTLNLLGVLEKRPDFNALLWQKKLREKGVSMAFSNYLPTLSGNVIYTYGARSDAFRLENDNDNIIVGLTLNIPIFSGMYTTAQVQKAKIEVRKVQTQISLSNEQIKLELQNVYLRLREAQQRIQAARKSVRTATRAFEIAESRWQNGLATQLELKDSRMYLDQARLNYYTAIYDYLNAYFDWEIATGNVIFTGI